MHRPHRWLAAGLAVGLLASGCSSGSQTIEAAQAPRKFGDAFEDQAHLHPGAGPPRRVESIAAFDFNLASAVLGSVVALEPNTYVDPAELDDQTIDEYAAESAIAVVRIDEVLHGPTPIEGEGGLIRVGLPGELTMSLAEANVAALAAGPMIFVAGDVSDGTIGDGHYLATIFVRDGATFSTPFDEDLDAELKAGMDIATFEELVAAFRAL